VLGVILNKTDMKLLNRYGAYGSSEHYLHAYSGYYVESSSINTS
jgi:succinoglycan biosynthesis transport protein ExoP